MNELIEQYWAPATRIVAAEAYKQGLVEADANDVLQETLIRLLRYPPKLETAKDTRQMFLGAVRRNAAQVIYAMQGARKDRPAVKEQGIRKTYQVGLFQELMDGDASYMDERMLPLMPSAEDAYLSSLPNKRQEALRKAVDALPERQRVAVTHQVYDELSVAESAVLMRLTQTEVQTARATGLRMLKSKLNPKQLQDA